MSRLALIAMVLYTLGACGKKKENNGLPPASKWHGEGAGGGPADPHGGGMGTANPDDPHAGVDMSGGGGGDDPANPHAGMDMSGGGGDPANPHGGMDMSGGGGDVPSHPVNPDHYLRGTIKIAAALKDKVKAGTPLFIFVKRPDPATGEGVGMPLVVEKLEMDPAGVPFDLSEENAMQGPGTVDLTGEVVITARYDQDSNATSKQPGDVSGKLKVTVPAKDLTLTLDTLQP